MADKKDVIIEIKVKGDKAIAEVNAITQSFTTANKTLLEFQKNMLKGIKQGDVGSILETSENIRKVQKEAKVAGEQLEALGKETKKTSLTFAEASKIVADLEKKMDEALKSNDPKKVEEFWKEYEKANAVLVQHQRAQRAAGEETKKKTKLTEEEKLAQREANMIAKQNAIIQKEGKDSIRGMRAQLSLTTLQWTKLTEEEIKNTQRGKDLNKQKTELTGTLKRLEAATGDNRRNVGNYTESMKDAFAQTGIFSRELSMLEAGTRAYKASTQALTTALFGQKAATEGGTVAMKIFRVALASTGIGLLIAAIASLVAYFTMSERGIEQVERATAFLKGTFLAVRDVAIGLGESLVNMVRNPQQALKDFGGLIKQFVTDRIQAAVDVGGLLGKALMQLFSGEFKAALETAGEAGKKLLLDVNPVAAGVIAGYNKAGEAIDKFGNKIAETGKKNREIAIQRQKLEDEEIAAIEKLAKLDVEIANARNKAAEQLDGAKRKAFLEEAKRFIQEKAQIKQSLANQKAAIEEQALNLAESTDEERKVNAEAQAEKIRVAQETANELRQINSELRGVNKKLGREEVKDEKANANEKLKIQQELTDAKIRNIADETEREIATINEGLRQKLETVKGNNQIEQDLRVQYAIEAENKIKKVIHDAAIKAGEENIKLINSQVKLEATQRLEAKLQAENLTQEEVKNLRDAHAEELRQLEETRLREELLLAETNGLSTVELEQQLLDLRLGNYNRYIDEKIAADQKRAEAAKTYADIEVEIEKEKVAALSEFGGLLQQIGKEAGAASVIGLLLQKGAAIASVIINAQQEIAGYNAAAAQLSLMNPLGTAFYEAQAIRRSIIAKIRAGIAVGVIGAQTVQQFDEGGNIAYEGGFFPKDGGEIKGRSHAFGGVKFKLGNKVGEARGGELAIVNEGKDPATRKYIRKEASRLNVIGGGKAFDSGGIFNSGGIAASVANIRQQTAMTDMFAQRINERPVFVTVTDINAGQNMVNVIEQRSTI